MPQRTIYYRRAEWALPEWRGLPLSEALAVCLRQLPASANTELDFRLGRAAIRHRRMQNGRIFVHVASWNPGQMASTVPNAAIDPPNADLSTEPPGADWDYLGGDGMMMVSGNHCLVLPSGITQQSMERYIKNLFGIARKQNANLPEWAENFSLVTIANDEAVQLLFDQGVTKISLDFGQYLETSRNREDARQGRNILQRLGLDVLMNLVERDEDRRQIEEAENVSARLIISLNRNRRGIQTETFTAIAQDVAEESPDDIEFVTTTGQRFKRGDLIIKRSVDLPPYGQTVDHSHSWDEMAGYFEDLQQTGILEL